MNNLRIETQLTEFNKTTRYRLICSISNNEITYYTLVNKKNKKISI